MEKFGNNETRLRAGSNVMCLARHQLQGKAWHGKAAACATTDKAAAYTTAYKALLGRRHHHHLTNIIITMSHSHQSHPSRFARHLHGCLSTYQQQALLCHYIQIVLSRAPISIHLSREHDNEQCVENIRI